MKLTSLVETAGKTTVESLAIIYESSRLHSYDFAILSLGVFYRKYVLKCIEIFITALITVTPNWKETTIHLP